LTDKQFEELPSLAEANSALQDAPWGGVPIKEKPPFDPSLPSIDDWRVVDAPPWDDADFEKFKLRPTTPLGHLKAAVTDIPGEIGSAYKSSVGALNRAFNPLSQEAQESMQRRVEETKAKGFLGGMGEELRQGADVGRGLLAVPETLSAPITGTGRSVIGHALAAPGQVPYEEAKNQADLAMMGLGARGARLVPVPPRPSPGPFGISLSEGQRTGDLATIQREQAALRDAGRPGHRSAQDFAAQQLQQIEQSRQDVSRQLDPYGQVIAEAPHEAGELVARGLRGEAARARQGASDLYDTAASYPGEIHAAAFEGMGQRIKGNLTLGRDPVIIDDKLTPFASQAIRDVDERIANLQVQNRADPFGQPNQQNIVGINLRGVEQMRKRLSAFRRGALSSGNAEDIRGTRAVIDGFDSRIDQAVNGGLFQGDPRAVDAWNQARAAYADYRRQFTQQGRQDNIGKAVEGIVGGRGRPDLTGNDVADYLYGSAVNPNSRNVNVARRIQQVLGDQSPEWIAAKQGLFSRLTETPQGVTDYGPGKVATRLSRFLNGDGVELARVMFAPAERQMLNAYAETMRRLQVPQAGANWSNTSVFVRGINAVANHLTSFMGTVLGHSYGGLPGAAAGYVIGSGAQAATSAIQARRIARQMPLVATAMHRWQRAVTRANQLNTPPSRAAATVAAGNLDRALSGFGIKLPAIGSGGQDNNGQQVPRPPQQQRGGRVGRQEQPASDPSHGPRIFRANGGRIKHLWHPVQTGAKRAKDGKFYLKDPDRPGKFLLVQRKI